MSQLADAKHFARKLSQTGAKRQVEMFKHRCTHCIRIMTPGAIIKPFGEAEILTSTPKSSWGYSIDPREEIASPIRRAGWPQRFIARRSSAIPLVAPVEVSL